MTLSLTGQNTFIGVLRPLPNPFTLYLRIFRSDEGALMAAFRNPEQHSHGPAMQYRVVTDGDDLQFTAGTNPAAPEYRLKARYLGGAERIRIDWQDGGGEIESCAVRRRRQRSSFRGLRAARLTPIANHR